MFVGESVGVFVEVLVGVLVADVQGFRDEEVLRGLGEPVEKSELLLSVSVQPFSARKSAVVLLGGGALELSLQFAVVPYPTKSITLAEMGHPLPVKAEVLLTSATLPAVADIFVLPLD